MTEPPATLGELAARLAATEETLSDALLALQDQLDQFMLGPPPPPAPNPARWADRATPTDWADLSTWVTDLNDTYSLPDPAGIPACWAGHPGVVEELAACREAWIAATLAEQAGQFRGQGSTTMSIWHRDALWPMLDRLGQYRSVLCTRSTHEPDRPANR